MILVRKEEEVGWVHDPDTTISLAGGGHDVEAIGEDFVRIKGAVAIGVFMDRDAISTDEFLVLGLLVGWGRWDGVEDRSKVIVPGKHLKSSRLWILDVFRNPETSALVELGLEGLSDGRFREDSFDNKIVARLEGGKSVDRWKWVTFAFNV